MIGEDTSLVSKTVEMSVGICELCGAACRCISVGVVRVHCWELHSSLGVSAKVPCIRSLLTLKLTMQIGM